MVFKSVAIINVLNRGLSNFGMLTTLGTPATDQWYTDIARKIKGLKN
jgi:hypothetical protein